MVLGDNEMKHVICVTVRKVHEQYIKRERTEAQLIGDEQRFQLQRQQNTHQHAHTGAHTCQERLLLYMLYIIVCVQLMSSQYSRSRAWAYTQEKPHVAGCRASG